MSPNIDPNAVKYRPSVLERPGRNLRYMGRRRVNKIDRNGDPLDGVVNLFDVAIILAVGFLLAALTGMALYNTVSNRLRDRGDLGGELRAAQRAPAAPLLDLHQRACGVLRHPVLEQRLDPVVRDGYLPYSFGWLIGLRGLKAGLPLVPFVLVAGK